MYKFSEQGLHIPLPIFEREGVASTYDKRRMLLHNMQDQGMLQEQGEEYLLGIDQLYALDAVERAILLLPEEYIYKVYVYADGLLQDPALRFGYTFYDYYPYGQILQLKRQGPWLHSQDGHTYILSEEAYYLCEEIDARPISMASVSLASNLRTFSHIRQLAIHADACLDDYLQNEQVAQPESLKVDVRYDGQTLEVIPLVASGKEGEFLRQFDLYPTVRDVYPLSDGQGGRMRLVLDESQKETLQDIKKNYRKVTDREVIDRLLENPTQYINPEGVDLSIFYSDRVIEIGLYQPKFYSFITPYKSEWIPGVEVSDRVNEHKQLLFDTPEKLAQFQEALLEAENEGKTAVAWENVLMPISEARQMIQDMQKQLAEAPELPKHVIPDASPSVLIIKDNADALAYVESLQYPQELAHIFTEVDNFSPHITPKLHQHEGIAWLQGLYRQEYKGCLLADDMGLGKTLQLLYFIEWHVQQYGAQLPYLVVAPVSLLENWEQEYAKFFPSPSLPVYKLYGKYNMLYKGLDHEGIASLQRPHIILTNYETLRTYQLSICAVDFAIVVLDEAQRIKTPGTLITNAAKALKAQFKVAMTGTPVENTLLDLWCIMDFAVPGLLGNAKDFAASYKDPFTYQQGLQSMAEQLRTQIGVFMKRRLKIDVAQELPPKYSSNDIANATIFSSFELQKNMPDIQRKRYLQALEIAKKETVDSIDTNRNKVLSCIWAIRDICDHPYLADGNLLDYSVEELVASCAKLQILLPILAHVYRQGEKLILFADRKDIQLMLQKVVGALYRFYPKIINGDTATTATRTKSSRQQMIDDFSHSPGFRVIIMSPLAAGVGLNVTAANHVVHYSRHWNPAKEEQATDRAYRIGQDKPVFVYYPMTTDTEFKTFDWVLDELLGRKKSLASTTLYPTESTEVLPEEMLSEILQM